MKKMTILCQFALLWTTILLFVIVFPLAHAVASPSRSALIPDIQAVITDSGSTNTCPYTIDVWLNGTATYKVCHRTGSGTLSPELTIQFFEHLIMALPFSTLPPPHCIKPGSFRTTTIVLYAKHFTLDISCPSKNDRLTHLYADSIQIQQTLGFSSLRGT